MTHLTLMRAIGTDISTLVIEVCNPILDDLSLTYARALYKRQAALLVDALLTSLPGGTVDELLVELLRRKASLFAVPLLTSEPLADDLRISQDDERAPSPVA